MDVAAWLDAFLREPTFLERYPFYAAILAQMHPVADPSVHRMAVSLFDGKFFLHVNIDAFVQEPQFLHGILLHEVHHVALGHLAQPKFRDVDEPELMELALEMSANEYIVAALPNPIVWKAYESTGLRAGQSTLERYRKLVEAKQARTAPAFAQPSARTRAQERSETRVDDHRFMKKNARANGDSGAVEHTRKLLQDAVDLVRARHGNRAEDDPKAMLLAGRNPGRLLEELTGSKLEATVYLDWKHALRMFVARERAPVHTWNRPSRRFPQLLGIIPGRTYVPRAVVRPTLLAVIDTSMSMTTRELEEIARHLQEMAQHARITIVECDVEITRTYAFAGMLQNVAGRGGTDLRPAFDAAFLGQSKPHGMVYFTDGDGPFPEHAPRMPVLWVLTKPAEFKCPWGTRASIALTRATKATRASAAKPSKRGSAA
jgi:predicted metal-dependent peptidase